LQRLDRPAGVAKDQTLPSRPHRESTASDGKSIFTRFSSDSHDRFLSITLANTVEKRLRRRSEEDG
jgi:hypothetical protein